MSSITLQNNQWIVSGSILVDNANAVLIESNVLDMQDGLRVNLAGVSDVDTAALSLLMEWQRRAIATNSKILFTHLPEDLRSLADLYGVSEFIPLSAS